ncbi:MAG TPA: PhnD/SsuA/transferrin family substrate-binding protein, partial [Bryobacteraceae bacterium]|nr:PhnD/SsuA/transferrin family substrate-binding protein [Bryobacteraceae bacterium]
KVAVNENDARAALKVWAGAVEKQLGMGIDLGRGILVTREQLFHAVRRGEVEGFAATVLDYLQVAEYADQSLLVLDEVYATRGEEYLILAHQESGIRSFRDLRGHKLTIHGDPTMCLAPAWLQILMHGVGGGRIEGFLSAITQDAKLSRGVVLPVFFRRADACMVTRRMYETLCELNPQLQRRLRIVETSPKLVPIVMAFQKDGTPDRRRRFAQALLSLPGSPVGQQLLALFQSGRFLLRDGSSLAPTIALVKAAERLRSGAGTANARRPE